MNAPFNSDSQLYSASDVGNVSTPSGYSPSVPISIYRELATELKTTQATVDALTQQNQQLLRQNKLLRTEIHRFVQAAEQLGHFAGVSPKETTTAPHHKATTVRVQEPSTQSDLFGSPDHSEVTSRSQAPAKVTKVKETAVRPAPPQEATPSSAAAETPLSVSPNSAIVPHPKTKKRDRPNGPEPELNPHRLFTEQHEGTRPLSKVASRADLGNLWLATTILLVVVSAFGAGFLIMRPLLNR
ncbi:hypothetical protein PN498_13855 [Oscillatoria sp. CS-180]|uniref:hypothetical protein n=1 Tax=Oscillatoria sp. CS-180 TaxID=3021720 RepID=UPI00232C0640|nr:hypothetical protein [Oscillatoria sp. CS-180]MDB9527081.1 hypothetical protein [Oscillatoria sp. CS-180]